MLRETCMFLFQSTHSLRSATPYSMILQFLMSVSIHALLAECDITLINNDMDEERFNPRTPCGVRPKSDFSFYNYTQFQSTHSLRSATHGRMIGNAHLIVSIHALLAECDPNIYCLTTTKFGFNPRTPCGVRLRLTIYIVIQQRKRYFAPTSRRRPSSPSLLL